MNHQFSPVEFEVNAIIPRQFLINLLRNENLSKGQKVVTLAIIETIGFPTERPVFFKMMCLVEKYQFTKKMIRNTYEMLCDIGAMSDCDNCGSKFNLNFNCDRDKYLDDYLVIPKKFIAKTINDSSLKKRDVMVLFSIISIIGFSTKNYVYFRQLHLLTIYGQKKSSTSNKIEMFKEQKILEHNETAGYRFISTYYLKEDSYMEDYDRIETNDSDGKTLHGDDE